MAGGEQLVDHGRPDPSRRTGDEDLHDALPLSPAKRIRRTVPHLMSAADITLRLMSAAVIKDLSALD
ncbi:hypothetical protein GCM10009818_21340 [Nakamurella flavida]